MPFLDYTGLTTFWNKVKAILSGKQNTLTAGEGVSLENDTVGVQEPVKGITRAQYGALTEEQKNTGLYVITDANINLNDRGDIYSTEETRVGTWIDGKPLYAITLDLITGPSLNTDYTYDVSSLQIDTPIQMSGIVYSSTGLYINPVPTIWGNDRSYTSVLYKIKERKIVERHAMSDRNSAKLYVFLKYTKTTDSSPTAQTTLLTSNIGLPQTMTLASSSVASDSPLTVTFPTETTFASASASSASIRFPYSTASASSSGARSPYSIASASKSPTNFDVDIN